MTNATDEATILSISMGAVNGIQITDEHTVVIDNIVLEETEAPAAGGGENPDDGTDDDTPVDGGVLKNANFANNGENWSLYVHNGEDATAAGTVAYADGKATVTVTNPGITDWHVKLLQNGLTLENGATYQVKFTVKSSATRFVSFGLQPSDYSWYKGGEWVYAGAGVDTVVDKTITIDGAKCDGVEFGISMGYFSSEDVPTPAESVIEISNITITKIDSTPVNTVSSGDAF